MKNISILGSTGSIGTQALDVLRNNSDRFNVVGLSTNRNIDILYEQIMEFRPKAVTVVDSEQAKVLKGRLKADMVEVFTGTEGLIPIAAMDETDVVLTSVVGMVGLVPTLEAIKKGKEIALANKETLVAGGPLIKKALKSSNSRIIPVDSEHCAVFQCLQGLRSPKELERIVLTASGGPFRGMSLGSMNDITPEKALKHPNWNMGRKISIDSATLMNKGLEVIEAHWLFSMDFDKIDVVVHPQSIIHSMVEFVDGSVIAQLGTTDMRNPILYALSYPERLNSTVKKLSLLEMGSLTFEEPDSNAFRCLNLAYDAGKEGGTMPAVLNAANEVAVELFLKREVEFLDIPDIVERAMMDHINVQDPGLHDILKADTDTRSKIYEGLKAV